MLGAGIAPCSQGSPRCCRGEGLAVLPDGNFGKEICKGEREGERRWGGRLKLTLGVWVGKMGGIFMELSSTLGVEVMEQQVEALVADTQRDV